MLGVALLISGLAYTAKVIQVIDQGDEVIYCWVCKRTWVHP